MKDIAHSDKIKELTEKYTQEIDADKVKYEILTQEKNSMENEYEDRIKLLEERQQQQLQARVTSLSFSFSLFSSLHDCNFVSGFPPIPGNTII